MVLLMAASAALTFLTPFAGIACVLLYLPLPYSGLPPMDDNSPVDERQWRVRNEATTIAYRILGLATLIVIAVQPAGVSAWKNVSFAMLVLVVCLPTALLAWREPDVPQDEA